MEAKLVVVSGTAKIQELVLELPAVIGRGREATVSLPHPLVSRKHCEVFEANGYLVVRDMGSLNGTFIDDERIAEAVLPPGGLLTLGSITLRAEYEAPEVGEAPEVAPAAVAPRKAAPKAKAPAPAKPADEEEDFEIVEFEDEKLGQVPDHETAVVDVEAETPKKKPPLPSKKTVQKKATVSPDDDELADFLKDFE
jgi:pSer/pThr/pTyr-binding forkhead associated (FHA) protein